MIDKSIDAPTKTKRNSSITVHILSEQRFLVSTKSWFLLNTTIPITIKVNSPEKGNDETIFSTPAKKNDKLRNSINFVFSRSLILF